MKKPLYLDLKDKRYAAFQKQLETNGFCDSETWCLDIAISRFILPRLKRFKQVNIGFPGTMTPEQWDETLDKMIFAFEWNIKVEDDLDYKGEYEKYQEGMRLFAEHFRQLWW